MKRFKPFLIIQLRAEDAAADQEFKSILKATNLAEKEVERIRAEVSGLPIIDLFKYSGIIVGGSPFDISTPQNDKSSIQIKVEEQFLVLLDKVVKNDFPFLGACSGCGQIGNYCGVPITAKFKEPISGVDMTLTEEGKRDKLLKGLPDKFRVLVGHKEACDYLPEQAVLLGSTNSCPIQMFRIGENVYATQFHPEADRNEFLLRIEVYKDAGYFTQDEEEELVNRIKNEEVHKPKKILLNFSEFYRSFID